MLFATSLLALTLLAAPKGAGCKPEDWKKCKKACTGGNVEACFGVFDLVDEGRLASGDLFDTIGLAKKLSDKKQGSGFYLLGKLQRWGSGTPRDPALAADSFDNACELGEPRGCGALGNAMLNGDGVPKDEVKGVAALNTACTASVQPACIQLAGALMKGRGAPKDPLRAANLYKKGCMVNLPAACVGLAGALRDGTGVEKNIDEAYKLAEKACSGGFAGGCEYLGVAHHTGNGAPKDKVKAAGLLERACNGKNGPACLTLATIFNSNESTLGEKVRVPKLLEAACDHGEGLGCYTMAQQKFAPADPRVADHAVAGLFAQRACELENMPGCALYGRMLVNGMAIKRNLKLGEQVLTKACNAREQAACDLLPSLK